MLAVAVLLAALISPCNSRTWIDFRFWANGVVPYSIDQWMADLEVAGVDEPVITRFCLNQSACPSVADRMVFVQNAFDQFTVVANLTFRPKVDADKRWIEFRAGCVKTEYCFYGGNSFAADEFGANVLKIGEAPAGCQYKFIFNGQAVSSSYEFVCQQGWKSGKIQHELGHAVGMQHTQNRSDVDHYIATLGGSPPLADRLPDEWFLGLEFDYASMMLYQVDITFQPSPILNETWYERQGRPLHRRTITSSSLVLQAPQWQTMELHDQYSTPLASQDAFTNPLSPGDMEWLRRAYGPAATTAPTSAPPPTPSPSASPSFAPTTTKATPTITSTASSRFPPIWGLVLLLVNVPLSASN